MRILPLLTAVFAIAVSGCAEKDQAPPTRGDDTEATARPPTADPTATEKAVMGSETFIRHMHLHASHLEGLSTALSAGNLEAAKTPAYWLLRHEEVTGHPDDWQPHIENMREAARAVTEASEIAAARTAARRIVQSCRGCHAAAGLEVDLSGLKLD